METDDKKIDQLENEVRVLKNEVHAVLLDLRERCLDTENPFSIPVSPTVATPQIIIDRQSPAPAAPQSTEHISTEEATKGNKKETKGGIDKKETQPETAHKEVIGARPLEVDPHLAAPPRVNGSNQKMNLVIIGGLASWVNESVRRFGRQRTEIILDVSEMLGYLVPDLKQIMLKLVNVEEDVKPDHLTVLDYVDSLVKITTLLGKDNENEKALLSILSGEDSH